MRSMSLVVDLIDLVTKHKSGELRCPATALIALSAGFLLTKINIGKTDNQNPPQGGLWLPAFPILIF